MFPGAQFTCEAEVAHFDVVVGVQEDVFAFDVPGKEWESIIAY